MLIRSISILIIVSMAFPCLAFQESVELMDGVIIDKVQTIPGMLSDANLKVLDVVIGRSRLEEVRRSFKDKRTIVHTGDAGNSAYSLCYRGTNGAVLTFDSSGEMGGEEHLVTNVILAKATNGKIGLNDCARSTKVSNGLSLGKLFLDMEYKELVRKMGAPSRIKENVVVYSFAGKIDVDGSEFDVTSIVDIRLGSHRIKRLSVSKIISQ